MRKNKKVCKNCDAPVTHFLSFNNLKINKCSMIIKNGTISIKPLCEFDKNPVPNDCPYRLEHLLA